MPNALVREYQENRQKVVGASQVNHEVIALGAILRRADLWGKIMDHYSAVPTPYWKKPRVFTLDEQNLIFEAAQSDPELDLASIVFAITRNTSACGTELRLARLQNLQFEGPLGATFEVTDDTTKNTIRPRVLPLNAAAEEAFRRAVARANRLGAYRPEDFIFPLRVKRNEWDPTQPASRSWLRKQTVKLREMTGIHHLRPHAWRHQLCTELLEKGAPTQSVRAIMGWCSERMIATYSHTRLAAKQEVIGLLSRLDNEPIDLDRPGHQAGTAEDVLANPTVKAEIERQVKLALEERATVKSNGTRGRAALRVISFPNSSPLQGGPR